MNCAEHPKYKAERRPRSNCEGCWQKWFVAIAANPNLSISQSAEEILVEDAKRAKLFPKKSDLVFASVCMSRLEYESARDPDALLARTALDIIKKLRIELCKN